jgi:hypothetical protein
MDQMRLKLILVLALLSTLTVVGQSNKGSITGTVSDSGGGVVAGATVTITNLGTNQAQTLTTSEQGSFSLNNLDPVLYSVSVESKGFKKAVVESIKVDTASISTANVTLQIGEIGERVEITADTPLLNTNSGTSSQTITERQIQDVPLFNRSVLDLAITTPNVSGDTGSEDPAVTSGAPAPGFNLSINGGRPGSSSILADGANNTGVGIARQVVSFSPETVQEFTVQSSGYSAAYGSTGGGIINVTTKSGTNDFHGVALYFTRNPTTNSQVWTNGTNRPANLLRTNQGSFTIGGPIYLPSFGLNGKKLYNGKDKSFFFFAFEPRWRQDFIVTDTLLPTDAMRGGNFSGLVRLANGWAPASIVSQFPTLTGTITDNAPHIYQQYSLANGKLVPLATSSICPVGATTTAGFCGFTGDILPSTFIDPVAVKGLAFLPHAGNYFLNASGQLSNYVINRSVHQNEKRFTTRIDHTLSNFNRLNFRYTEVPAVGLKGFGSDINGNSGSYSKSRQMVATDSHIFSANVINELRLNYTRGTFSDEFTPEFSVKGGRNLATELGIPSLTAGGMPLFNMNADGQNAFSSIGASGSTNNFNTEEQFEASNTVYYTHGNQSWKFGASVNHSLLNVTPFFGASGGSWIFRALNTSNNRTATVANGGNIWASYLMGVANSVLVRPSLQPYYYRWNSGSAFAQNDWKIKQNLTLNLGLRYSLQLPRTEKYNNQGAFRPDLAQTIAFPTGLPANTVTILNAVQAATGTTINSARVVPFALSGQGGRSRYLYDPSYTDFEPRFGFAYSPQFFGLNGPDRHSLVIRGGYGISHAPLTGNNRLPNPDFGATVTDTTTTTGTSTGTADLTQPIRLNGNAPFITPQSSLAAALAADSNGLVYMNSLGIPGVVVGSKKIKTPSVQNWNLTLSYELTHNTVLEVSYAGSKGTNLFLPLVNINARPSAFVEALEAANLANPAQAATFLSSDSTIPDPLGRRDLAGNVIAIPIGTLGAQYLGVNHLNAFYNAGVNSMRNAGWVSLNRRIGRGLSFTANYTFSKSIDEASDSSPDKSILSSGSTLGGNTTFGGTLASDRSLSAFDVPHAFAATYVYDLPFGKDRRFLKELWAPLNAVFGGWTTSGVFRLQSGYPFFPTISDTNRLSGDLTHTIRPDIVSGAPLVNPLYSPNCKVSTLCEPYINPAAFVRPVKGTLGDAARTLNVRGPIQRYFDASFQKTFPFPFFKGESRRIQFRVDLNNAFNHPNFRIGSGNAGPDFMGLPGEAPITAAEYDAWVAASPTTRAARNTPAGAANLLAIQNFIIQSRTSTGALPLDYYHVQLPQGFATMAANGIDILSLGGYKLYRLRQAYSTSFGQLRELGLPRYVQFGIKIYF